MKNSFKKYTLIVLGINAAFFLGGCSAITTNNSALLTATKDGAAYEYPTRSADVTGTNYASKSTSISQGKLASEGVGPVLPSTGNPKILVIPVELTDFSSVCTETTRTNIYKTFFGASEDTAWESVASYYAKSSYGNLILSGTVSEWYDSGLSTSKLLSMAQERAEDGTGYDPTWDVLEGAIKWYEKKYQTNCSEFDANDDGIIDGVWLVYSAPYYRAKSSYKTSDYQQYMWAYTYSDVNESNTIVDSNRIPYTYSWAAYDFMYEGYTTAKLDAHTFIHETGHLMGLDDYYSYPSKRLENTVNYSPMGKIDMMDYGLIDHDVYSKFALDWVHPYVVTGSSKITLHPSATSGECVLLPTTGGWNGSAFDEYLLLEYYAPILLNEKDSLEAYPANLCQGFTEYGVRIYHVDARMASYSAALNPRTQTYTYSYTYTDKLVALSNGGLKGTIVAHSNSNGANHLSANDRLIQELDCTEHRNFDTDTPEESSEGCTADNGTLFQSGDSFSFDSYAGSFPEYVYDNKKVMNDGTSMPYGVSFSDMSESGITLTITKA
jgi:M6 family metalloprotease-like protein